MDTIQTRAVGLTRSAATSNSKEATAQPATRRAQGELRQDGRGRVVTALETAGREKSVAPRGAPFPTYNHASL